MLNLTPILQAVIGLIAALLTAYVIPYLKRKYTAEQQAALCKWISIAVSAAEQMQVLDTGTAKKAYVVSFLESKGYTVDLKNVGDTLNALIESAVYTLKGGND